MTHPPRPPFELTIADPNEGACAAYHRYFRNVPNVHVKTSKISEMAKTLADGTKQYDALVLPLPNCHGVTPALGPAKELISWLGIDFATSMMKIIHNEHFGELLPGDSFIITPSHVSVHGNHGGSASTPKFEISGARSADSPLKGTLGSISATDKITSFPSGSNYLFSNGYRNFKVVVVVCAFRVLTPQGDSMAWVDPCVFNEDWAYNSFQSALRQLHVFNQYSEEVGDIIKILVPDFHMLRSNSVDPTGNSASSADKTARQISLAWKHFVTSGTRIKTKHPQWADAILLHRTLVNKDSTDASESAGIGTEQNDLLSSLSSSELESRLLYSLEELEVACQWVKDLTNADRQLSGAKLIANTFSHESASGQTFGLSRSEIARIVSNKDSGCLQGLLEFVQRGQIKLYVEIAPEDLAFGDEIGVGQAGSVMRATWRGKPVAVKKFRGVDLADVLRELSIMSLVQHPNLVNCYGGCVRNKDTIYIVQELMDCNISDALRQKNIQMDLGLRLRIAIDVAKGVNFLHSHCNLVHRDLKSLNLLATVSDRDIQVKVCDFGVSRVVDRRKAMTGNVGTVSWIAPEVFDQKRYSEKADVYSFGIVLWELITRKVPFADVHPFGVPVAVIKGERPSIPKDVPTSIKKLIRECWQPKASKRPPFAKVIEILTKILEQTPPTQRTQTTFNIGPLLLRKKTSSNVFARHQKTITADKLNVDKHYDSEDNALDSPKSPTTPKDPTLSGNSTPNAKRTKFMVPEAPGSAGSPATQSASPIAIASPDPDRPPKRSKKVTTADPQKSIHNTNELEDIVDNDMVDDDDDNIGSGEYIPDTPPTTPPATANSNTTVSGSSTAPISNTANTPTSPTSKKTKTGKDEFDAYAASSHSSPHSSALDSESPDYDGRESGSHGETGTLTTSTSSSNISIARRAMVSARSESILPPAPQHTRTVTCTVPDKWAPPIAKLEVQVNKYFSKLRQDLDSGTIVVGNERYLLFRSKSLAVDFFKLVQSTFTFDHQDQSLEFAQNFLYDLGTAIGKSDSMHFLASASIDDPVARNNAGLVHVAYTGMAFVNLRPESIYAKHPEDECLLFENTYSFESYSWNKSLEESQTFSSAHQNADGTYSKLDRPEFCTCMMTAGYLAGWGEGATGSIRATAEISCKAKGDHQCLFVRAMPYRLEGMVKKLSHGNVEPIPRFLKSRSDTLPPTVGTRSSNADEDSPASWFQQGFRQLFKKSKKSSSGTSEISSPKPATKFNPKIITPPELSLEAIDIRASRELNSFFIDPTTATIEMAEERCVLLRGDSLAFGFYSMVQELFGSDDEGNLASESDKHLSRQFAWKFLYDLGKTIGTSNMKWFADKIGLQGSPIERINALPVNMAYFGWCDLIIKSGNTHKELTKLKENFVLQCEVGNSFEAASWTKSSNKIGGACVCYMHAGYLCGWIEFALKTSIVAVETACTAQGARACSFTIAHASNIKRVLASNPNATTGLNTATALGVLPLLAKFKEKRRESTPMKPLRYGSGLGGGGVTSNPLSDVSSTSEALSARAAIKEKRKSGSSAPLPASTHPSPSSPGTPDRQGGSNIESPSTPSASTKEKPDKSENSKPPATDLPSSTKERVSSASIKDTSKSESSTMGAAAAADSVYTPKKESKTSTGNIPDVSSLDSSSPASSTPSKYTASGAPKREKATTRSVTSTPTSGKKSKLLSSNPQSITVEEKVGIIASPSNSKKAKSSSSTPVAITSESAGETASTSTPKKERSKEKEREASTKQESSSTTPNEKEGRSSKSRHSASFASVDPVTDSESSSKPRSKKHKSQASSTSQSAANADAEVTLKEETPKKKKSLSSSTHAATPTSQDIPSSPERSKRKKHET